ncbi:hypothetical protein [Flavobacterium gelatinilyticum]|uniref:hypothetical protein n=1 Tax=Flavobacterium gelatinilyticum TaxID=3003260 RepID=UPI0024809E87|nr:hypothetical protein [Flavobacterium gelatinilyticum]
MTETNHLTICTWKVLNSESIPEGTAFFISENLLLTSLHVVEDFADQTFYIENRENAKFKVTVKDSCKINDLAILITEEFNSENIVILCDEDPLISAEWSSFGFPATVDGSKVGSKIAGTIFNKIDIEHTHDIVLETNGIALLKEFRGFSGSGVLNCNQYVTAVLRYKDVNHLCSVSIKKAKDFLIRNNVAIKNDELGDFTNYVSAAFDYTSDPFKGLGQAQAKAVAKKTSPQNIAVGLGGKLMVPERSGTLQQIIGYLKSQTVINQELWRAWLEFLTYVQFLKGEYSNINAICISLPKTEVSKLIPGVETPITQDINLTLQFYFTEEKVYFDIAKEYILEKSFAGTLQNNQCHIFHSHNTMFGLNVISAEDKKKIVFNIAGPPDAGLNIAESIYCGILSFTELSRKVTSSQSLEDITDNLTKIFTDAIS